MPSLLTGLFRFPILKGRPHSLVHYSLCVIMHACTLLRSSFKRPLSLSFFISSISVSASPWDGFFTDGGNSPFNERQTSLRFPSPNWLFASQARRRP
ncbi:uncharacterized protein BJ212DRAFT_1476790 [Suillus subaureus]|uniref:Uncharacterized protein n=1 Tax=Suillus subaureus TaxID=48587 RepID=A0A9P7EK57_9AGAM|nr:uncharacterized protein BJ212DRAFT_1476790 [Suillus subaureus]KAG1823940.1 hypothetical protein BJ212DRAFT_1476790 [Suillus subaureus]